jgi:hypothetical protein
MKSEMLLAKKCERAAALIQDGSYELVMPACRLGVRMNPGIRDRILNTLEPGDAFSIHGDADRQNVRVTLMCFAAAMAATGDL